MHEDGDPLRHLALFGEFVFNGLSAPGKMIGWLSHNEVLTLEILETWYRFRSNGY